MKAEISKIKARGRLSSEFLKDSDEGSKERKERAELDVGSRMLVVSRHISVLKQKDAAR